jgi:hypothetical protein
MRQVLTQRESKRRHAGSTRIGNRDIAIASIPYAASTGIGCDPAIATLNEKSSDRLNGTRQAGQRETQNTPATRQFKASLEEFNAGDKTKFQAFLEKNYPDQAKRVDGLMGFRHMTGGFDLKKAEKADATTFVGIVKERIGSMNKMFTAVSTLQLVQDGKLKLTRTVGTGDFFGPELANIGLSFVPCRIM